MKRIASIFSIFLVVFISCKTKKDAAVEVKPVTENAKTLGVVSHQYRNTGCQTVVMVQSVTEAGSFILIPKDKLGEFDIDKQEIYFNYRRLRMPNPAGCLKGFVAEITDIEKK